MAESISGSAIAATVVGIVVGSAAAFNYDGRGNPTEVIDSATAIAGQSDTTRYSWDGKFDQLTSIVPPERDSTVFSVDVNNGNRLWQQPGADLTRRVLFDYYSSGNGAGMVRATELPGGARDSVIYDAMGNAIELKTPLGQWTRFERDGIGRDTVVKRDITIGGGNRQVDTTAYDLLDRVVSTKSFGPAMNGASAQSARTSRTYDAEGNLLTLARSSVPDTAGVGTMTTTWRYDNASRPVAEVASDGLKDSTRYDPAGNVIVVVTRRNHRIAHGYDALNRKTSDTIPSVSYPNSTAGIAGRTGQPPYGYTVSGDTAAFTFDAIGNLLTANNRDAKVKRVYDVKGLLSLDSLWMRIGRRTTNRPRMPSSISLDSDPIGWFPMPATV